MINVTKTLLPELKDYVKYLEGIWERGWLTNHGQLATELENKLQEYLGVKHLILVNNGTIALQIAIKALDLKGDIITTPFSYVATTSSIVWENCKPVFCDINPDNFTVDVNKLEKLITKDTTGMLFTHVYGIPCDHEKIEEIAKKHNIKVIYDGAHAFGVKSNGTSVLNYGDVSTLSFHATKLFHSVEGGAMITSDDALSHRLKYMRNFGHNGPEEFYGVGINGKISEFHSAMGLCILPLIDKSIEKRKRLSELYDKNLLRPELKISRPVINKDTVYNYSYYPIVLESTATLMKIKTALQENDIFTRRYFYPSLNTLNYTGVQRVPVSEDISTRVLCLPIFDELEEKEVLNICGLIVKAIA